MRRTGQLNRRTSYHFHLAMTGIDRTLHNLRADLRYLDRIGGGCPFDRAPIRGGFGVGPVGRGVAVPVPAFPVNRRGVTATYRGRNFGIRLNFGR